MSYPYTSPRRSAPFTPPKDAARAIRLRLSRSNDTLAAAVARAIAGEHDDPQPEPEPSPWDRLDAYHEAHARIGQQPEQPAAPQPDAAELLRRAIAGQDVSPPSDAAPERRTVPSVGLNSAALLPRALGSR